MFNAASTARFNSAFKNASMHPTTKRLFDAIRIVTDGKLEPAKALDQSSATITNWKARGVSKEGRLLALARYSISPKWVENCDGPMLTVPASNTGEREPIDLINNPDYPAVRRVQFKLSAGATGFGVDYLGEEDPPIVFKRDWFASNGYRPEALFAVRVANGSMEPGLYDGDTVVVNTGQTEPKDGKVFAVNYEGELVIKRLVRDGGQWWLASDNPDQTRYPRKQAHDGAILLGEIVHKQSERI